ncbi:unnamed protein product [Closterium sp. NIES-65]|nr:unnamed protein product [Closterium sp. NIES-65]
MRIPVDHNFWSQLRADTVVAATPSVRAGGVAIVIRNSEVSCIDEVCDASGRLARATLSWRGVVLTVVAAYFPSSPTARATFFRDVLQPLIAAIPAGNQLMLAGDLNVVEDPALDKTSGAGSRGVHEVRHVELVKRFTDHWFAVHLKLSVGGDGESGPGLWRLPALQAPRPGVRKRVEQIVRKNKERGGDLESLTASLRVGLKAYTVEERKRVAATTTHLVREVGDLRQRVMNKPWCSRAKAQLAKGEAKLKAYEDGRRQKLHEQAGVKVEMSVRRLPPKDAEELCAPWEEAEVKCALEEMARGKTPGRDGLPKELWELQWDLLGGQVMQFLKEFERTGVFLKEFSTPVTVLLHKKGAKDDLQNYRPITLLSTAYKVIAKVPANRIKRKLEKVVSEGQFGFLPGTSPVAIATDVIDAANSGQEDWLMLFVDFRKAFDSVGRNYLFDVLRNMGFLEAYLDEAERLLKDFERQSGLAVNWDNSVVLPLGKQRDLPPPTVGLFKWASRDDPERLLGVWITPGGDARPSWKKALSRIEAELKKWEAKYLTTTAQVTVVNSYVMPIAMFQAQLKRVDGGLGVINLKDRLDAEALHALALLLTEEVPQRRVLAENAANLPLGYASFIAHESLLKAWGSRSERWKAIVAAVMASPVAMNLPTDNRWDTEKERVLFNTHIKRDGGCPFGRRKGSESLRAIMVGDLLMKWVDGTRSWKGPERLARDLGSKQAADIAAEIIEAVPREWKERLLKPLTAEELFQATRVVCTTRRGVQMWWILRTSGNLLHGVRMRRKDDGKAWWVPEGARPKAFSVSEVTPMALLGDEVVGELGDPRVRLLKSELCVGRLAAPLRQLRVGLEAGHEQPCKPLRREEWEKLWGRKIDWKRTIVRRDSHAVSAKARDVLPRSHCFNLQVGDRLKVLGDRAKCPHYGEAESVDHALFS